MGLQGQLNDVSSDSIPLLLVALVANCIANLRSCLFSLFHFTGLTRFGAGQIDPAGLVGNQVGSGLAGLIVLAEQLNLNRMFSYRYSSGSGSACGGDCVVCLCRLRDGDQVRKLECRHVFHKECFDGWLDHLNFNCPLCRSSLVSDDRVISTRRRVGGDLVEWFSLH
ncbi:hypothetical protein ACOSP7_019663 [Xanthoceras sorbifolium]|uniref:RING-type domain-containing protein n=1 Tax=Xanthoceras sorbifolium TaxID=99658 RepID=A0ABQ8I348_9ROSI|nr:hypothetical protein JRO89_XS05G0246000 [Xanthoceras sorbifolium]